MRRESKISTINEMAIFTAIGLILSYIESLINIPMPIPFVKLGLSNIVVLIAIVLLGYKNAIIVALLKSLLLVLVLGRVSGLMYSFPATIASAIVMSLSWEFFTKKYKIFSVIGISVIGSFVFNSVQIITASIILKNVRLLRFIPAMTLAGVFTGIFIGLVSKYLLSKLVNPRII